jgi:hypothetical protein
MKAELFGNASGKRPIDPRTVVDRDLKDEKLITSSGPPLWLKRKDPLAIENAIQLVNSGKWKDMVVVLGSRSQRQKERFIFIPSMAMNIAEKQFLYPIQDLIRQREIPFFAAYEGFSTVEKFLNLTGFFDQPNSLLIQMDYEAMDKYMNECSSYVYKYVCGSIFQESYVKAFEETVDHVFTVPVLINFRKIITGRHGIPSGSGYTNSIETVWSYYVAKLLAKQLAIQSSQGLGDDLVFNSIDSNADKITNVISEVTSLNGFKASEEKQRVSEITLVILSAFESIELKTRSSPNP